MTNDSEWVDMIYQYMIWLQNNKRTHWFHTIWTMMIAHGYVERSTAPHISHDFKYYYKFVNAYGKAIEKIMNDKKISFIDVYINSWADYQNNSL